VILSSAVVFLSEEYAQRYFLASVPLPSIRRAQIAPNGIDLSHFTPVRRNRQERPFTIGMIGRMVPGKDFDSLIRAVAQLSESGTDIELRLAGDGPRREVLEALASSLGVSGRITFAGYLEANEIPDFMRSLDLYVHATFGETHPTAILQAYAAALPVVGSDVPGVNTLIRDRTDARLVSPGDPTSIAKVIDELRHDAEARAAFGRRARERALSEFGAERMVECYLQVLARCDARGPWAAALRGPTVRRNGGCSPDGPAGGAA
jgi:glycosyltransferase involved in cell wall biosynthesis